MNEQAAPSTRHYTCPTCGSTRAEAYLNEKITSVKVYCPDHGGGVANIPLRSSWPEDRDTLPRRDNSARNAWIDAHAHEWIRDSVARARPEARRAARALATALDALSEADGQLERAFADGTAETHGGQRLGVAQAEQQLRETAQALLYALPKHFDLVHDRAFGYAGFGGRGGQAGAQGVAGVAPRVRSRGAYLRSASTGPCAYISGAWLSRRQSQAQDAVDLNRVLVPAPGPSRQLPARSVLVLAPQPTSATSLGSLIMQPR